MAATRLIPLHENKGKTVSQCLKDRVDYAKNGEKTEKGEYVTAYECNPQIVDQEFYSDRSQYIRNHRVPTNDVIAYQIRQSFKPGEITPEEANAIGYELAKRFTKGDYAFIVATHTDKAHIHNHIIRGYPVISDVLTSVGIEFLVNDLRITLIGSYILTLFSFFSVLRIIDPVL